MSESRILIAIERAFRGSLEVQYGHILWTCWSLRRLGSETDVLLCGDAVLYARRDHRQPSLAIGDVEIPHLPDYGVSIEGFLADGGAVYVTKVDLERLQIESGELLPGVEWVRASELVKLFSAYDMIWYF